MRVCELTDWLEQRYPAQSAEEWDNVGLLVGDDTKEVHHAFLALDATMEVIEQAEAVGAHMIITHHPMLFSAVKKINNHTETGRKILRLIRKEIPLFAMHTNYDVHGMAALNADTLELSDTAVLSETEVNDDGPAGFGRVGNLPREMTLRECAEHVKSCNRLPDVRVYGDPDRTVYRLAVCGGSGKSMLREVFASGADVYVTGDIDYHTAIDAVAEGLCIIDAGHYGTEYMFMEDMKKRLGEAFPELRISCAKVKQPFIVV